MTDKTSRDNAIDLRRRELLKFAGASAAVGGFGLSAGLAHAASAESVGGSGEILDVAIIGAGLSGLTAARDLKAAGSESFVVLEARDRVGGRTYNHDMGNGHISDAGGQWIGPGQTAVADLARELNVETFPHYYQGKTAILGGEGRLALDLKGTFGTDHEIAAKLSKMSEDVPSGAPWKSPRAAEFDKLTVGDFLAKQNIKPEDWQGWNGSVGLSGGTTPAKMGLLHFLSMISSANNDFDQLDSIKNSAQETNFVGGSQTLSIRMAEQLGDHIRLSSPVRQISGWDGDIVTLHTDQGPVRARRVIMALSPPLCQQIQFSPALPAPRAALQRAWPAYSPARKTAMAYARPFWRDKGLNGHIFQIGGPVIWAYDNSPRDADIGIINAFVFNAQLPADHEAARQVLTQIYARGLGEEALHPLSYYDHDWGRADPWTITCISAIPPGFWTTHGEALRPPCGNLIWSGTETADIWAGYMDGAVRSGHQAALTVLNSLRKS